MTATVDPRATLSYVGTILKILSAAMSVPLVVGLIYGEDALAWLAAAVIGAIPCVTAGHGTPSAAASGQL